MSTTNVEDANWGSVTVGKDVDGHWEVRLENSRIFVRYGFKMKSSPEGMITDFVVKDFPDENIAGSTLEAAAHRGELRNATIARDNSSIKTVRLEWDPTPTGKFKGPAISEVSIFSNSPYIKIDYLSYCFPHVCDIGSPGGIKGRSTDATTGGKYVIYGAQEWQRIRAGIADPELRNHPNEHHRVTDDLYPLYPYPLIDRGWAEDNPMIYKGWYIMGVYNEENGRGYGRILPVAAVPYIKLLWNRGFELFPYWREKPQPHTEYLFVVTQGADEIISLGKELVDEQISKTTGEAKRLSQERFSRFAQGYVTSEAHAKGDELDLLVEIAQPQLDWVVLDVATGSGHTALKFAPLVAKVIATDITPKMLSVAQEFLTEHGARNVDFKLADAEDLSFEDEAFNLVTCRIAPHHFPDCARFVREAARVVKRGGLVLVQDHLAPEDEQGARYFNEFQKLRDPSHNWAYSEFAWISMFEESGLKVGNVERIAKRHEFLTWAERQGCSAEVIQQLVDMVQQAPPEITEWMEPSCFGTDEATFLDYHIVIAGWR